MSRRSRRIAGTSVIASKIAGKLMERRTTVDSELRRRIAAAAVETLELRVMLSTIVWTNEGQTSDGFASVFGSNAAVARSDIDAVITTWEREIINFNYAGGGNTFNVSIQMASSGTSSGANTSITSYNSNGSPTAASITIGRGYNGSGGGYFLDPTPLDSSEFTNSTTNAYSAYSGSSSPANGLNDLYEIVLHEMGHAMGFVGNGPEGLLVTNTNVSDTVDSNFGGVNPPVGTYWRFDGSAGHFLLTSFDSGGQSGTAINHGSPDHFADAGASYTSNGITYLGEDDLMTPYYSNSQRRQISQDDLAILQNSYGYTVQTADYYGTQYDTLDADGELHIGGPSTGNNTVKLSASGGNITVNLTLGSPVAGADPSTITSIFPASAVSSIDITNAPGGTDTISLPGLGVPLTLNANGGSDNVSFMVTNTNDSGDGSLRRPSAR